MPLRMLGDKVLLKPDEEEKTVGGILLPDTAQQKSQFGKVLGTGEGALDEDGNLEPMPLKKGDRVVFQKYAGMEVREGEDTYLVLSLRDVLAKEA